MDIRDLLNQPTLAAEPYEVQQYLKRVHKIQEQIEVERQKIHVQSKEKGVDGIPLIAFSIQLLLLDFYYDTTKQIQRALEDLIKPLH
jgi:hypothetical protein